MGKELRTEVPEETYEELQDKAPVSADISNSALLSFWLDYALRQWELEEMRATGRRPERNCDES